VVKIGMFNMDGVLLREKEITKEEFAQMIEENGRYWFSEESKDAGQVYWKVLEREVKE